MTKEVFLSFQSENLEYQEHITRFISSSNPEFHADAESIVEAVMSLLIASRNIRLGPAPSIESQFEMRKVVRYYLQESMPIPVLIPSGPKKTKAGEGVDLAELSMLNILNCLNNAIKLHYPPGLHVVMRLEDLTGEILEPEFVGDMNQYILQLEKLIKVLDYSFITPWRETFSGEAKEFRRITAIYTEMFYKYVTESTALPMEEWTSLSSYKELVRHGWTGLIPLEQRKMYLDKYTKLYPSLTIQEYITLMCKYFACSLARKILKMTGIQKSWTGGNLEIGFMSPVPEYVYPTRFYYRSVELKNSKFSIPFWRAKGFLKIREDNSIRISSCTWKEAEDIDFFKGSLLFTRGDIQVAIQCDYVLED